MFDLVIRGGEVITPEGRWLADVAVRGEEIAAVGAELSGRREIDASGCYVIPGGVDPHVHLQLALGGRVSSDSFSSGTIAAACGGTTTVIDFAVPMPGESLHQALSARRDEADGAVATDYGLHITIPTWHAEDEGTLSQIAAMVALGSPTFKLYQAYPRMALDDVALLRVCQAVAAAGGRVVLHSECGPLLDFLRSQALEKGHTAPIWHERTRPARLEATAVHRAAEIAQLAGCPLHIFHVGCAEAVAEIRAAQGRGVAITGESCPQYLLLNAEEHLGGPQGELFVCAPPLRSLADQVVLWGALADGTLDMVSTDHCPWKASEKRQPDFTQVPGGVPSIEARMALIYSDGVRAGHLTLERWVELCSSYPAQWMGLQRKGQITPGKDADLVIFDPKREKQISASTLHEKAGWTPYDGHQVTGWPRTVTLRGEIIVMDEQYVANQTGRFVSAQVGGIGSMFLFFSKLLPLFVYPVGLASLLLIASLFLQKRRRLQQICVGLALAILLLFGNEWVAHSLVSSLEWRYLPSAELPPAQAIVLLGGGTRPHLPPRPLSEMNEAGDRIGYAAKLYHEKKAPFIVVSGGFIDFFGSTVPEADAMKELLLSYGVPAEDVVLESRSRNTYENALYVREIADEQEFNQILLVTSGLHMPRSQAIFKRQGFEVIPAPVDFLATWEAEGRTTDVGLDGWLLKVIPNSERLDYSTRALREYIGIFIYWIRGWL